MAASIREVQSFLFGETRFIILVVKRGLWLVTWAEVASRMKSANPVFSAPNASRAVGKHCATYPANLCPIQCGGAMSHSGPRTTILHSEGGHCKRFL
jgi:hypothetical protein